MSGLGGLIFHGESHLQKRGAPPDRGWPYGYEGQEAPYVLFRSLVLLGVIGFGLSSAVGTLIARWGGAVIAPLRLEPVAIYTFAITG